MKQCRGFSLLEVMLAIAIVLALSGVIYTFLFDLLDSRDRILDVSDRSRVGSGVIEQIERSVTTAIAGTTRTGTGIEGTPHSVSVLSRGVTLPVDDDSQTVLGDLQGVSFSWDDQTGELRGERWDALSGTRMRPEVLTADIEYLQFRFFDGSKWSGSFASSDGLPVAIEISIWYGTPKYVDDDFGPTLNDTNTAEPAGVLEDLGLDDQLDPFSEQQLPKQIIAPERVPDRIRVMVLPDGPSVGWEDST